MIERELKPNTDFYIPKRKDFGTSRMSEIAFLTIQKGVSCQAILEEALGENGYPTSVMCNKRGVKSVHFDAFGNEDFIISCNEHLDLISAKITSDLGKQGRGTVIAINGWGRA